MPDVITTPELFAEVRRTVAFAWSRRRLVVAPLIAAASLGLLFAMILPVRHSATMRLIPYRSGGNVPSGISGLAGLAGLRLPAGGLPDAVISSDIYPEVATSIDFRLAIANRPIATFRSDSLVTPLQYFERIHDPSLLERVHQAGTGLRAAVGEMLGSPRAPRVSPSDAAGAAAPLVMSVQALRDLENIGRRFNVVFDKRSGIILISAEMPDGLAAASLAESVYEQIKAAVVAFDSKKADEQLAFLDRQLEASKARYDSANGRLADFIERNRSAQSAAVTVARSNLENDVSLAFELYQQVSREREQAAVRRQQDIPAFAVLERAVASTERASPKRLRLTSAFAFFGLIAGLVRISLVGRLVGWRP